MVLALGQMRKAQTTFWPQVRPGILVRSGIFSRARNPIYPGDALLLFGADLARYCAQTGRWVTLANRAYWRRRATLFLCIRSKLLF